VLLPVTICRRLSRHVDGGIALIICKQHIRFILTVNSNAVCLYNYFVGPV
jgi:hypothetical protein